MPTKPMKFSIKFITDIMQIRHNSWKLNDCEHNQKHRTTRKGRFLTRMDINFRHLLEKDQPFPADCTLHSYFYWFSICVLCMKHYTILSMPDDYPNRVHSLMQRSFSRPARRRTNPEYSILKCIRAINGIWGWRRMWLLIVKVKRRYPQQRFRNCP